MNTHEKLLPCPFCGGEAQFRKALWPSDGNTDAIIHAAPSECGLSHFDIGTTDESVIAAWNRRTPPAAVPDGWEPTPDMVEAARSVVRQILVDAAYEFRADRRKSSAMFAAEVLVSNAMANAIKAAMISAAPAAPTEASDE